MLEILYNYLFIYLTLSIVASWSLKRYIFGKLILYCAFIIADFECCELDTNKWGLLRGRY